MFVHDADCVRGSHGVSGGVTSSVCFDFDGRGHHEWLNQDSVENEQNVQALGP